MSTSTDRGSATGELTVLDAESLRHWSALALAELAAARETIDALNVFPVPDGDTGTNLFLTMQSAVSAMNAVVEGNRDIEDPASPLPTAGRVSGSGALAALARGALLGARGNSGVILSELLRGVSAARTAAISAPLDGHWLATALTAAAQRAYAAVSHPKEGTVLTVARVAAEAARQAATRTDGALVVVCQAAADAGHVALAATTSQLEALRRAGVVDAGGQGYMVLLDALAEVVTGVRRALPEIVLPAELPNGQPGPQDVADYGGPAYEVMYLLEGPDQVIPGLRDRLGELGDSVVVVGGEELWNIHVHVDDAGAAIEAGMAVGRPYRIRVTYLDVGPRPTSSAGRALVVVTHGAGVTDLLESSGVTAVRAPMTGRPSTAEMLAGILHSGAGEVVLLPSDKDSLPVAEAAALAARQEGLRVAVIPSRSIVQSLSAVAVHDDSADFDDDVVAMTRAAASTHYAGLTTAIRTASTPAGTCEVGDELGVVDGEIMVIGSDVQAVARSVIDLMLSHGGELVTVVLGEEAPADFMDRLTRWGERAHPGVDFIGYEGGQPNWHAIVGVE